MGTAGNDLDVLELDPSPGVNKEVTINTGSIRKSTGWSGGYDAYVVVENRDPAPLTIAGVDCKSRVWRRLMEFRIVPCRREHIQIICENLRVEDEQELTEMSGTSPLKELLRCRLYSRADERWAIVSGRQVVMVYGLYKPGRSEPGCQDMDGLQPGCVSGESVYYASDVRGDYSGTQSV